MIVLARLIPAELNDDEDNDEDVELKLCLPNASSSTNWNITSSTLVIFAFLIIKIRNCSLKICQPKISLGSYSIISKTCKF